MSFGSKLSEIRIKSGISQEELAERLEVSVQTVHRWEHDKSAPNIHQVKTLCEIFGVNASYFFEETEQMGELASAPATITEEAPSEVPAVAAEEAPLEVPAVAVEEAPLEMPDQGREGKASPPAMLFANKWYYWICLVPWFIMFAQSLEDGTGLIFSIGSCIVWAVFTFLQELSFRFKTTSVKIQFILNVIKTLAIMTIALYSAFTSEQLLWKMLFIFVCCMSVVICAWEIVLIKNEYKNRKN